ncbi:MAG: hypothetical protein D6683_12495 [Actinomyces sp.]|nr:MAG: hypothetical protein D6683_12495 [Actinomyces sp.]
MPGTDEHTATDVNPYLSANCAPVPDEITAVDLPVTGVLPDELDGLWVRNGPNPARPVDPATHHWFLGDGMVHGVRLGGGRAHWYRNRWVRGDEVADALGEPRRPGPRYGGRGFAPNTSVGGFAGRIWALVEAGATPMTLTAELDTIAYDDFDGTLPGPFTAHPKYAPDTGELHAVCYAYPDLPDRLHYVVVAPDGHVSEVVEVPVTGMPMVHDMSLTARHAVVYDLPVTLDLDLALAGHPFPFAWNPDHGARVGLVPRAGGHPATGEMPTPVEASDVVWCEAPLSYVFHPLNAHDTGDGRVVLDVCRYETMFATDRHGPFGDSLAVLARWTVDPRTGRVDEEIISDRPQEFPRHHPAVGGRAHRWGYTATVAPDPARLHGPTLKVDLVDGTVTEHDHGPGRGGGEPLVVPRGDGGEEDEAWLLVLVHDATTDRDDLVVLDAADLAAPPVATVHLPRRVPYGFHGNWIPADRLP